MVLLDKIHKRTANIGVIGLGYVGLPLVIQFVKSGFETVGFDIDKNKIRDLKAGKTYIKHIPAEEVGVLKNSHGFKATTDFPCCRISTASLSACPRPWVTTMNRTFPLC